MSLTDHLTDDHDVSAAGSWTADQRAGAHDALHSPAFVDLADHDHDA